MKGSVQEAAGLMMGFAERTGLISGHTPQRYLWTDAFAVCNFLELTRATGDDRYTKLALRLVDQVHHVLGRYRTNDLRSGWLSGLSADEGEAHPTQGGLRIGKRLPERRANEPRDERLEWERDGQYFHYLTKWMHALDQVSRATREPRFNLWARELAWTAHHAFACGSHEQGGRRMVWKMSTDLSYPLIPSMGQHDPLDGLVTYTQLQTTASMLPGAPGGPNMEEQVADFATMTEGRDWLTLDPLGLGGLLMDACRIEQLMARGAFLDGDLLETVLAVALEGLRGYARQSHVLQPASQRLAFRELGLSIGLQAIGLIGKDSRRGANIRARLAALHPYVLLSSTIESFWLDQENRRARTWSEHCDINDVMLATSIAPDGLLVLPSPS